MTGKRLMLIGLVAVASGLLAYLFITAVWSQPQQEFRPGKQPPPAPTTPAAHDEDNPSMPSVVGAELGKASARAAVSAAPHAKVATHRPKPKPTETEAYYASCAELRRDHPSGVASGQPGYRSGLDRNRNGYACER